MATPPHQAVGLYTVKAPFTVVGASAYICESIQGFEALIDAGVDIFNVYYAPYNLTQADYMRDLKNNENIITLLSATEDSVVLPSSYILSFPDTKAVPYGRTFITFDLGALPHGQDLSATISHVKQVIDRNLGITSVGKTVVGPITDYVDYAEHGNREQARKANVNFSDSPLRQLELANKTIASQGDRITLLQAKLLPYL